MKNALILIDIQNDYFKNGKNELYKAEEAAEKAKKVLDYYRKNNWNIFHVRHISLQEGATFFLPDSIGSEIHSSVAPITGEKIIIKHAPNAFYQTGSYCFMVLIVLTLYCLYDFIVLARFCS